MKITSHIRAFFRRIANFACPVVSVPQPPYEHSPSTTLPAHCSISSPYKDETEYDLVGSFDFTEITEQIEAIGIQVTKSRHRRACDVVIIRLPNGHHTDEHLKSLTSQAAIDTLPLSSIVDSTDESSAIQRQNSVRLKDTGDGEIAICLHDLARHMRSDFLAVHSYGTTSSPRRLLRAIESLEAAGGDVFISGMRTFDGTVQIVNDSGSPPADSGLWPTMVLTRRCVTDLAASLRQNDDSAASLHHLAIARGWKVVSSNEPLVTENGSQSAIPKCLLVYSGKMDIHASHSTDCFSCDTVVQLEPTNEDCASIRTLCEQLSRLRRYDVTLHVAVNTGQSYLIEDIRRALRYKPSYIYRNRAPLNPYLTLNNLLPMVQSRFVALQDPYFLSDGSRYRHAAEMLQLSNAKIFIGRCTFKVGQQDEYCVQSIHSTAMYDVVALANLLGFADLGQGVWPMRATPIEFVMRAKRAGARIDTTTQAVAQCHNHAWANADLLDGDDQGPFSKRLLSVFDSHCSLPVADLRTLGAYGKHFGLTERVV